MSNSNASLELYDAVEENSLVKLELAVANGADVNFRNPKKLQKWISGYIGNGTGNSALHLACWMGSTSIITRLLDLGADPNLRSFDLFTPLHYASYRDPSELHLPSSEGLEKNVLTLVERGADVNVADRWNTSPLEWAAEFGRKEIVEVLLDNGANPNNKNIHDLSSMFAIHQAARMGHKDIVDLLLSRGAIFNEKCERWAFLTPAQLAGMCNKSNVVPSLSRWPVSMGIILLEELCVYHHVDFSSFQRDLIEFIGEEKNYYYCRNSTLYNQYRM